MSDDLELLRDYVRTGSEPAFAELVQRHKGLVYASAWRSGSSACRLRLRRRLRPGQVEVRVWAMKEFETGLRGLTLADPEPNYSV